MTVVPEKKEQGYGCSS